MAQVFSRLAINIILKLLVQRWPETRKAQQKVFRQMGVYLGIGLASLINVINPEVIIVGGGLANGWQLFEKHMQRQITERSLPIAAGSVKIARAQCGDNAGLLGAAWLALTTL
jgi:glucokinase